MKKVKLNIKFNVPDNFICGDCNRCPLRLERYSDNHYEARTEISCKLGFNSTTCPIEVDDRDV